MDNRSIIAIVLIILLWSGYSIFFTPSPPIQQQETPIHTSSVDEISQNFSSINDVEISSATEEKLITISSDIYNVVISSRGAAIKSLSFYNYKETNNQDSENFYLINADDFKLYSFKTNFTDGISIPSDLLYTLNNYGETNLFIKDGEIELVFTAIYNNFTITKTYTFYSDYYHVSLSTNIANTSNTHFSGKYNISIISPWSSDQKSDFYSFLGPLTFNGNKLLEDKPKDIQKSPVIYANPVWSGFTDKYFLQALNPQGNAEQVLINYQSGTIENRFSSTSFVLLPEQAKTFSHIAFIGPKKLEYLSSGESYFDEAIHFGFFHFLAKPLFDVLRFFYSFLNNYGFSIILLTVCIKLIFWPLTHKSYKSMQGMQKLQPEMKRLKEKYADDKQRLNQEMMSFYRDNKVNPLGGCLPILIQIPVFFSLYKVLLDSIELRHAPFMLWITDLSAKDPLYITPIIMGASMFLQQKLTPTNLDPTQEKVMLMMPVIFTFLFLNFPAGLVIYWLVNNLLTILQQLIIRRQSA